MVVREFVSDDGLEFLRVQQRQHRSGKHDMTLARHEIERGVELRAVLCLVQRDGNVELQAGLCRLDALVEIWIPLGIEPVRGLEQLQTQVFGVIGLRLSRGEPLPQFTLLRLEVVPQLDVIRQRLKFLLQRVHRHAHEDRGGELNQNQNAGSKHDAVVSKAGRVVENRR